MSAHPHPGFLPFNLHGLTLEAVYARFDKEISELQGRLCSLRTFRNSLAPVAKLPTEILSKIFIDTLDCPDPLSPYEVDVKTRCFLSWVCRHWRGTAIATPELWTTVSKKNRDNPVDIHFAKELLIRSRNLDLAINLFQPTPEVLEAFIPNMRRIQHMRVADVPFTEMYPKLFSKRASVLLSLEVTYDQMLEKIFSDIHPQLRRLVFRKADLCGPLDAFSISTLTTLHIIDNRNVELDQVCEMLRGMENLTEFVMERSLRDYDERIIPPSERVELPRLQSFSIQEENTEAAFGFLRCLDIPQALITLTWPEEIEVTPEKMHTFMLKLRRYQYQMQFPIHHLKMTREDNFTLDISSTRSQHRHSFVFRNDDLEPDGSTELFFDSGFRLDQVTSFFIDEFQPNMLRELSNLPTLTRITLYGSWTLEGFLGEFKSNPNLFPALKRLTSYKYDRKQIWKEGPSLEDFLAARRTQARGLDKLVFMESPGVDVTRYKKFVKTVTVE